jgi:hypothetical protein
LDSVRFFRALVSLCLHSKTFIPIKVRIPRSQKIIYKFTWKWCVVSVVTYICKLVTHIRKPVSFFYQFLPYKKIRITLYPVVVPAPMETMSTKTAGGNSPVVAASPMESLSTQIAVFPSGLYRHCFRRCCYYNRIHRIVSQSGLCRHCFHHCCCYNESFPQLTSLSQPVKHVVDFVTATESELHQIQIPLNFSMSKTAICTV